MPASHSADPGAAARTLERQRLQALRAERLARLRTDAEGAPVPTAVLRFHRPAFAATPAPEPVCDLDRLPGVGPDLVWALTRAGLSRRADLARLEAAELAARLGAIGRLAPVDAWIADARAAAIEAG